MRKDKLFERPVGWFFKMEDGRIVGPFAHKSTAIQKHEEYINQLLREAKAGHEAPKLWTCCGVTRPLDQRCSCGEEAGDETKTD